MREIWVFHRMLLCLNIVILRGRMLTIMMSFFFVRLIILFMTPFFESLPTVILFMVTSILDMAPAVFLVVLTLLFLLSEHLLMLLVFFLLFALGLVLFFYYFLRLLLGTSHLKLFFRGMIWCLDVPPCLSLRHLKLVLAVGLVRVNSPGSLMLILRLLKIAMRINSPSVFIMSVDVLWNFTLVLLMMAMRIDSPSVLQVSVDVLWSFTLEMLGPAIA